MPVDNVAKIRRLDTAQLVRMLQNIRNGNPVAGWARGMAFEHIVLRAFEIEQAEVVWPYNVEYNVGGATVVLEQIDGVVRCDGVSYLVESKDHRESQNIEPIAKLRTQLSRRPAGTMGIVFARGGFSQPAKLLTRMMSPLQILLWEFDELEYTVQSAKMCPALRVKLRWAVESGAPDYDIRAVRSL